MILSLKGTKGHFYPERFELTLERCRPARLKVETVEPAKDESAYTLAIGDRFGLATYCPMLLVEECQLAADRFESFYIEPLRYLLDRPFPRQLLGVSYLEVYRALAKSWQMGFSVQGTLPKERPENLLFMGNCRNSLDQTHLIFGLGPARWQLDWELMTLNLLGDGAFSKQAVTLDTSLYRSETSEGLQLNPVAGLRPYTRVQWLGKEEVVDRLIFDSYNDAMTLRFDSQTVPAGNRALTF
ncbi:MAG: hypothetical protein RRB13_10715 [bacterium]|nr:hypothetical protein [bacterium]